VQHLSNYRILHALSTPLEPLVVLVPLLNIYIAVLKEHTLTSLVNVSLTTTISI